MTRGRLTPAQELARATRGLVGHGVPGSMPVIRVPPSRELAIEPLVPQPIEMPPGVADPTRPGERMAPALPRGQTRGSASVVNLDLNGVSTPSLVDIADSEDRSEAMTLVASVVEVVPGAAGNFLSTALLLIDWGASGGLHSAIVDLPPLGGTFVTVHASALRARGLLQGTGLWTVRASVGAYEAKGQPATRTLFATFSAAGTVDVAIPAFATHVRCYAQAGLGYSVEWRDTTGVTPLGFVAVAAGQGEAGPLARPLVAGLVRVVSAVAQRITLVFELAL